MDGLHKTGAATTTNRAALYARVSSDDGRKDGRNLKGQLDMCREYAERHGWCIVAELSEDDRGASGASFDLPALNRLLEMARAGDFDVLVVREIDRLSRSLAKQLIVEEELRRDGVHIEYVLGDYDETPEGQLMKNVRAVVSEYERLKITERMTRGRRQKARSGSVMVSGRPPYGYRLVDEGERTALEIDQAEARIVQLVFLWYAEGDESGAMLSLAAIARKLTEMSIPTCGDTRPRLHANKKQGYGAWSRGSIHRMLRNETYAGVWHYGKTHGWRMAKRRTAENEQIKVEVPAIVGRELWDAVQTRLEENRRNTANGRKKHDYLLSGRVTCGACGLKMSGHASGRADGPATWFYYRCPARARKTEYARECELPNFRADHVDAAVWEWVETFLTDPAALECGLREIREEREEGNARIKTQLEIAGDKIADRQSQLGRLLDLYLSGDFDKDVLSDRKVRLEAEIASLERERASLAVRLEAQTLSLEQIESIKTFAEKTAQKLGEMGDDFGVRRRLVEGLDVQVKLSVEGGQKTIHVSCLVGKDECELSNTTKRRVGPSRDPFFPIKLKGLWGLAFPYTWECPPNRRPFENSRSL